MTKEELAKTHAEMLYKLNLERKSFRNDSQIDYYEKLIPFLQEKNIDPEIYFGVLIIDALKIDGNRLAGYAHTVTSDAAIDLFIKLYEVNSKFADIRGYVVSHYLDSQKEAVLKAYELGEAVIKQMQIDRGFDRKEALTFCTDFDLIPDLFILVCKEFYGSMRYTFLKLRPRLDKFINKTYTNKHINRLKDTIKEVRFELFPDLVNEAPKKPQVKQKKHRDSGVTRLRETWRDW